MRLKFYIFIIVLIFMSGCVSPYFENDSKDVLIAYIVRQNTINEFNRREQEKIEAVKQFQIQAIKAGFAYWDVDERGNVSFKWITTRKNK